MVDRNRIVSCLSGSRPSWNYAPLLDWQWDVGFFSPRKTFRAIQSLSSRTAAGFGGGWPSCAPRLETEQDRDTVKVGEKEDRDRQFAVKRTRTTRCSYEPSWEHLTFQSLTKRMGKFGNRISPLKFWECWNDAVRNFDTCNEVLGNLYIVCGVYPVHFR